MLPKVINEQPVIYDRVGGRIARIFKLRVKSIFELLLEIENAAFESGIFCIKAAGEEIFTNCEISF